jgi:hypothetical protein
MATKYMASCFPITLDIYDVFLVNKVNINDERKNNVKIINLDNIKNLGVIS